MKTKYIIQAKTKANIDVYVKNPFSLNYDRAKARMRNLLERSNIYNVTLITEDGSKKFELVKSR